jgi:hypothetical protein
VVTLGLNQELPKIDEEFEAIAEGEEFSRKENGAARECCDIDGAKRSPQGSEVEGRRLHQAQDEVAALEALVGNPKRIDLFAGDLVPHYERRVETMEGRATVCASESRKAPRFLGTPSNFELTRK